MKQLQISQFVDFQNWIWDYIQGQLVNKVPCVFVREEHIAMRGE